MSYRGSDPLNPRESAWANAISIQDICMAAGWLLPSTFARFYNLDVSLFALHVLSVRAVHAPTQPQL